jgi:hypothetical protein
MTRCGLRLAALDCGISTSDRHNADHRSVNKKACIIGRNNMAHDPQWLYVGRRTLMARLLALASSVPVVAMGARSAAAQAASRPSDGAGFAFGILGDMPYTRKQEAEYTRVLDHMNARDLAFVAHVGDMVGDPRPYERDPKAARQPATD